VQTTVSFVKIALSLSKKEVFFLKTR